MANPDSQESKYWKLMNELKQKIVDDTYQAGDKMPSENGLAAFYQVSRHTVRKALAILEHEGYIYAIHGKGTFCSEMGLSLIHIYIKKTCLCAKTSRGRYFGNRGML